MSSTLPPLAASSCSRRTFLGGTALTALGAVLGRTAPAPAAAAPAAAGPATSSPWQIGCYTRPWAAFDYRVAFDAIAAAGYRHVGLMTTKGGSLLSLQTTPAEAANYRAEAHRRGLGIISAWGGNFLTKPSMPNGVAGLKHLIDRCADCGCPNLLLGGVSKPEQDGPYYEAVAECCAYAVAKGVGLSVKPHGGTNSTGAQCRRLIARVNQKNFGLWYDPGNIFYYSDGKLDPVDDAAAVDGLVVGMCVKDFRPPKEVNLTPGTGRVDFSRVFARLQQGGFRRGPLVVECLAPGDLAHLQREATAARQFLEKTLA